MHTCFTINVPDSAKRVCLAVTPVAIHPSALVVRRGNINQESEPALAARNAKRANIAAPWMLHSALRARRGNFRIPQALSTASFVRWDDISPPRARATARIALGVGMALWRAHKPVRHVHQANTKTTSANKHATTAVRATFKHLEARPQLAVSVRPGDL